MKNQLIIPKHEADLSEVKEVLRIYSESGTWMTNEEFKRKLQESIGGGQYKSSYTKKAQIPEYFGFIEWQNLSNKTSPRRITPLGNKFYTALTGGNNDKIFEVFVESLETVEFGRNNCGAPSSNSLINPPNVMIRASYDLGGVTLNEFAFILWEMFSKNCDYADAVDEVKKIRRKKKTVSVNKSAYKWASPKPMVAMKRWGFLTSKTKTGPIEVSKDVDAVYGERLRALKVLSDGARGKYDTIDEPTADVVGRLFREWLKLQPSQKGGILKSGAESYASKLRVCFNKTPFENIKCKNAYEIVDVNAYRTFRKDVESTPGFDAFDKAASSGHQYLSKALAYYEKFLSMHPELYMKKMLAEFSRNALLAGLSYDVDLVRRFVSALLAKPFVVLTGLSGSGKTKLAESFTRWLCGKDSPQYKLVAVGADWTTSEKLLGYPNALKPGEYVLPDTGVLQLIMDASKPENADKPFFLILDEMNLSHVERYFSDFLSTMESIDGPIRLYDVVEPEKTENWYKDKDGHPIPPQVKFPHNLFVIGTMNVDETTYMFSPKVLDRAQVIEFTVSADDLARYFSSGKNGLDFSELDGKGVGHAEAFYKRSTAHMAVEKKSLSLSLAAQNVLGELFPILKELGAEFGFRTVKEFGDFVTIYSGFGTAGKNAAIDAAIVQKLLPKLHGSQGVFEKVLKKLLDYVRPEKKSDGVEKKEREYEYVYPVSAAKIERMMDRLRDNGFASFAEA